MNTSIELFLDAVPVEVENITFPASKRWKDKDGNPIMWEMRMITQDEFEAIRKEAMKEYRLKYGNGKVDVGVIGNIITEKCAVASTVVPDLNNAQLQDKMGVYSAEDLLKKMLCVPGEYQAYIEKAYNLANNIEEYEKAVVEAKND